MEMIYVPHPIDTREVDLSPELIELTEMLAKNAHDIWAIGRINEGWVYGEERNDERRTTPCLVPYEELSDKEKEYDRNTAMETLKAIVALGFTIRRNQQ